MKEPEILREILQHDARNLQLKRRLAERGIDWRTECKILCRFRAATREQASELTRKLSRTGFAPVSLSPVGRQAAECWLLQAERRQSLEQAASHEFTEEMVRLAASLSCFYDGWQARIASGEA